MNINFKTATKPFIGALALIIATPFNAMAQAGPEEIVVTARKREESLQDVPISISAFSADQMQAMGLSSNNDVAAMTVPHLPILRNWPILSTVEWAGTGGA